MVINQLILCIRSIDLSPIIASFHRQSVQSPMRDLDSVICVISNKDGSDSEGAEMSDAKST